MDMKAKTIKEIRGSCIPTIPVGTEFTVVAVVAGYGYATCLGLAVSSVWLDEFVPLGGRND
jgi:hypothetical protein